MCRRCGGIVDVVDVRRGGSGLGGCTSDARQRPTELSPTGSRFSPVYDRASSSEHHCAQRRFRLHRTINDRLEQTTASLSATPLLALPTLHRRSGVPRPCRTSLPAVGGSPRCRSSSGQGRLPAPLRPSTRKKSSTTLIPRMSLPAYQPHMLAV